MEFIKIFYQIDEDTVEKEILLPVDSIFCLHRVNADSNVYKVYFKEDTIKNMFKLFGVKEVPVFINDSDNGLEFDLNEYSPFLRVSPAEEEHLEK